MKIIKNIFDSVLLIQPQVFTDNRGFFFESYQKEKLLVIGIKENFIQDNQSFSKDSDTVRGMHFQSPPHAQTKLIRVIRGSILNVVIDIRKGSPTFKKHKTFELSSENKLLLYLPVGFANGFKTLEDDCEIQYKVDKYYAPESDNSFAYNDKDINIGWDVKRPILSERDKNAPSFSEIDIPFLYGENS